MGELLPKKDNQHLRTITFLPKLSYATLEYDTLERFGRGFQAESSAASDTNGQDLLSVSPEAGCRHDPKSICLTEHQLWNLHLFCVGVVLLSLETF